MLHLFIVAHIFLSYPPNRHGNQQKQGPCGIADSQRTEVVTVLEPGATVTVVWDETINHPGHFRLSFDPAGDDGFAAPATREEFYSNDLVLADNIADAPSLHYEVAVTLPDLECDTCTLQLIQVMYDKPPYSIPGNDIYYNCADITLRRSAPDAGPRSEPDASTGPGRDAGPTQDNPGSSSCRVSAGTNDWWALPLFAVALVSRRRPLRGGTRSQPT